MTREAKEVALWTLIALVLIGGGSYFVTKTDDANNKINCDCSGRTCCDPCGGSNGPLSGPYDAYNAHITYDSNLPEPVVCP